MTITDLCLGERVKGVRVDSNSDNKGVSPNSVTTYTSPPPLIVRSYDEDA
jgi:hypothetical protein